MIVKDAVKLTNDELTSLSTPKPDVTEITSLTQSLSLEENNNRQNGNCNESPVSTPKHRPLSIVIQVLMRPDLEARYKVLFDYLSKKFNSDYAPFGGNMTLLLFKCYPMIDLLHLLKREDARDLESIAGTLWKDLVPILLSRIELESGNMEKILYPLLTGWFPEEAAYLSHAIQKLHSRDYVAACSYELQLMKYMAKNILEGVEKKDLQKMYNTYINSKLASSYVIRAFDEKITSEDHLYSALIASHQNSSLKRYALACPIPKEVNVFPSIEVDIYLLKNEELQEKALYYYIYSKIDSKYAPFTGNLVLLCYKLYNINGLLHFFRIPKEQFWLHLRQIWEDLLLIFQYQMQIQNHTLEKILYPLLEQWYPEEACYLTRSLTETCSNGQIMELLKNVDSFKYRMGKWLENIYGCDKAVLSHEIDSQAAGSYILPKCYRELYINEPLYCYTAQNSSFHQLKKYSDNKNLHRTNSFLFEKMKMQTAERYSWMYHNPLL